MDPKRLDKKFKSERIWSSECANERIIELCCGFWFMDIYDASIFLKQIFDLVTNHDLFK